MARKIKIEFRLGFTDRVRMRGLTPCPPCRADRANHQGHDLTLFSVTILNFLIPFSVLVLNSQLSIHHMSQLSQSVSIHPYFKVKPGKLDAFKETMKEFVARTATEDTCLYYDFSVCGDQVSCRESYIGAAGVLRHLENVGSCIEEALTLSELCRIEIHGPAAELDQLRVPLADLNPEFYEHVTGVAK